MKLLEGQNIHPVGGDGISKTEVLGTSHFFGQQHTQRLRFFTLTNCARLRPQKPLCFLQIDTSDEHIKKCHRHDSTPHNAREALLAIHETCVKHREVRTTAQLVLVEKNRMAECANRKYRPGDSVDFFKNMVNPQRTCGMIIEQVMDKQYKVRYGDNQHTKVATQNMLLVNSQGTEANP